MPQVQVPVAEQPSPLKPHAMQATPPVPHSIAVVDETQVAPAQQPLGQLVALQPEQLPPLHV